MRQTVRKVIAAAVVLAAWAVPCRANDAAEIRRLQVETQKLRAQVAQREQQVQMLQLQLAAVQAQLEQMRAQVLQMRQQMEAHRAGIPKAARGQETAPGPKPVPRPRPEARLSRQLDVRVEKGGWGDASTADIQKVLLSAAGELWKHCPDCKLAPILVRHGDSGPISLYDRGPKGEYVIKLDVEGTYWCQFAYQFAHEFCHVLTNYSESRSRKNKWFEESLAEAASQYAVRQMGRTWKTNPPYPNWKSFAAALTKYAADLARKQGEPLPPGTSLARWYRLNEGVLRKDPYQRDKNRLVARALLKLLEAEPAGWEAVAYINLSPPDAGASFRSYLAAWRDDAPAKHKPFVQKVAGLFDIRLP